MTVRILEAPSVAWAARELVRYEQGLRKDRPQPYEGELLGKRVVQGRVYIDEDETYTTRLADGGTETEPLWHVFVRDLHFRDVTAEHDPEHATPKYPLPGPKPYRAREQARLAAVLGVRLARQQGPGLLAVAAAAEAPAAGRRKE